MSRWKAAGIHLSISVAIGIVVAILIFGIWYPPPYSQATGALELTVLLLGVDLTLGPLLTLIVFESGKKSLRFDLSVIALFQICALAYGLSVVVRARPAFIVGAVDRFVLVTANELDDKDLSAAPPEFRSVPWTGPRLVIGGRSHSVEEHNQLLLSGLNGKDIEKFPQYFVSYDGISSAQLLARAKPLDALSEKSAATAQVLEHWRQSHGLPGEDIVWLPLNTRRMNLTMLLDRRTGATLDALPIDPW